MPTKSCSRCKTAKTLKDFPYNRKKKEYYSYCKECMEERTRCYSYTLKDRWSKRVRRICIGVLCRGEKEFMSKAGERVCHNCKSAIRGMADTVSHSPSPQSFR